MPPIPRSRLTALLDGPRARPLTLISAPAGYGKTTLLNQWAAGRRQSPAWLSLDPADDDAIRFWDRLIAALTQGRPGFAAEALALLHPPDPPRIELVVNALLRALAGQPPLVLVMDDLHEVQAPDIHTGLRALLEQHPPNLRVLLATRADPDQLPLPRWRAEGRLAELRAADLRLTPAETADLLREATGQPAPPETVAALDQATEGWAAALQLAGLALPAALPPMAQRHVFDYLASEVFDRLPAGLQEFLLSVSILDRLSSRLCAAVLSQESTAAAQSLIESLERQNLFVQRLDAPGLWFRLHPLFVEFLRGRAAATGLDPTLLHSRAAAWLQANAQPDDAIHHWLQAGQPAQAAALIDRHAETWMRRGEAGTLRRHLRSLPAEIVHDSASLCLWLGWCQALDRRTAAAEATLDRAEAHLRRQRERAPTLAPEHAAQWLQSAAAGFGQSAIIRAQLAQQRGDPTAVIHWCAQAEQHLPQGEHTLRCLAALHLALANRALGDLSAAQTALDKALALSQAASHAFLEISALVLQGELCIVRAQLRRAALHFQRARTVALDRVGPSLTGPALIGLAGIYYEQNNLPAAQAALNEAQPLVTLGGQTGRLLDALILQARLHQAQGHPDSARETLAQAEAVALESGDPQAQDRVAAWQARLALQQSDTVLAQVWATQSTIPPTADRALSELIQLMRARVKLALETASLHVGPQLPSPNGTPRHAQRSGLRLPSPSGRGVGGEGELEVLATTSASTGRPATALEASLLLALSEFAAGRLVTARAALGHALSLAEPEGYLRLFADEGPSLAPLLADYANHPPRDGPPVTRRYLDALLVAVGAAPAATNLTPDSLTNRERDVPRLLAAGHTNPEIADRLAVAVGTANWHTKRIYRKLGVRNRTQAAARARELGYVS